MSNIIYANGRVSAKINSLVGSERLNRMIETDSPEDAYKILSETGFGGDLSAGVVGFEKSLSYELSQLDSFIREVCNVENNLLSVTKDSLRLLFFISNPSFILI